MGGRPYWQRHDRKCRCFDGLHPKKITHSLRANQTPRHVPAKILAVTDIPRTRSGKISEIAVREAVHGRPVKNIDALANPEVLAEYRDRPELQD